MFCLVHYAWGRRGVSGVNVVLFTITGSGSGGWGIWEMGILQLGICKGREGDTVVRRGGGYRSCVARRYSDLSVWALAFPLYHGTEVSHMVLVSFGNSVLLSIPSIVTRNTFLSFTIRGRSTAADKGQRTCPLLQTHYTVVRPVSAISIQSAKLDLHSLRVEAKRGRWVITRTCGWEALLPHRSSPACMVGPNSGGNFKTRMGRPPSARDW